MFSGKGQRSSKGKGKVDEARSKKSNDRPSNVDTVTRKLRLQDRLPENFKIQMQNWNEIKKK